MAEIVFENLPVDVIYGLKTLSSDQFSRLTVLPENTRIEHSIKVIISDVKIEVFNKKYIKKYALNAVKLALGESMNYPVPNTAQLDPYILPKTYAGLVASTEMLNQNEVAENDVITAYKYSEFVVDRRNLQYLLGLFTVYPEFGPLYEEYQDNPDSNVLFANRNMEVIGEEIKTGKITANDLKISAHLLVLLMGKSFNSTQVSLLEYVRKYMENRAKAVRFALDDPQAKFMLSPTGLEQMGLIWNTLPKLKELIFNFLFRVRGKHGEISAAISLLGESSMVTIKCIMKFIDSEMLTLAHLERKIWKEIKDFLTAATRIQEEMGPMWPHYRIIKPKDTTLSATNFPNLAPASITYCKAYIDTSETFGRIVVPNTATIPGLLSSARALAPADIIAADVAPRAEMFNRVEQEIAEKLRIDLTRWITPRAMRARLGLDQERDRAMAYGAWQYPGAPQQQQPIGNN